MRRRLDRTSLALVGALLAFIAFGAARVAAPVSLLGLLFDQPLGFAAVAAITSLVGAILMFVPRVERGVGRAIAGPAREPSEAEAARVGTMLQRIGTRSGVDPDRLMVRVQEEPAVNASAGAGHLLFLTSGALALEDEELEAILAHELGHHRGLHPILGAVVWWLRLPGVALEAVYTALRRLIGGVGQALGPLGRLLAIPLLVLVLVWQVTVLWLHYAGEVIAQYAARLSEFQADRAAATWGYSRPLAAALEKAGRHGVEPEGRVARLMADHPPLEQRLERLDSQPELDTVPG